MKYTIYKHTNKINGKSYIGQTLQVDLRIRFKNGRGYRQQTIFFKAILKYGWENFTHEVLEVVATKELADEREQYYIKFYNTYVGVKNAWGYNATPGGDGGSGFIWAKEVYQIDLDGTIVAAFESKMEASRQTQQAGTSGIALSCRNLARRTSYGYYWCHAIDYEAFCIAFEQKKLKQLETARLRLELENQKAFEAEERARQKLQKHSICQFNSREELIAEYSSIAEAEAKTGIAHSGISLCCSGKAPSAGGYYWCFLQDKGTISFSGLNPDYKKEVLQLDKDKNILARYANVLEAQKATGLINIHSVCILNKFKSTGGYYWCLTENYENFKIPQVNYKTTKIRQLSLAGEEIRIFNSIAEAVRELNLKQSLISKCCTGERNSTGGFKWEYIDK